MIGVQSQILRASFAPIQLTIAAAVVTVGAYGVYASSSKLSTKSGQPETFGRGPAFASLRLDSIETLSHDTKRFRFKLPTENSVSGLNLTCEPGFIDLAIKKYPNGKASTHIHSLSPGDHLFFLASISGYPWKLNEYRHITLIAGGA
ncbi:hypothetical protein DH86_00002993 [Scytalidium sp. 3C]|nr:hypothetical protein DH86_00002993 [Scytalidium sp. 3C]